MPATIRHTGRRVAAVMLAGLAAAACTDSGPGAQPTSSPSSSTTRPAKPAPPDANLRDVRKAMIYGDGIAYVLPETAAQMICGALSRAEWSEHLGGPVGRAVYGGVAASCAVAIGPLTIDLQMTVEELGAEGERIAGRRVKVGDASSTGHSAVASAAVVPVGEQDVPAQQRISAAPVLRVRASWTADEGYPELPGLLRGVLGVLLPRLTPSGPATPVSDAAGKLAYSPVEPVAGVPIYDLPRTVQSLVLCTVLLREAGATPRAAGVFVNSVGECVMDKPRSFAKVDQFLDPVAEASPYRILGRPAEERVDIGIVVNLLAMPREHGRTAHLTLRLNNFAPSARLRPWAEKVAAALLTG